MGEPRAQGIARQRNAILGGVLAAEDWLVFLHVAILKSAYRAARHGDPRVSFYGTWIFCFWVGQVFQMMSGDLLTYWRVLPLYFWVLAVAVRAADEHPVPRPVQ